MDVFPGDRKEKCGGMMEPITFEKERGEYTLAHKCAVCGYTKRNKMSSEDDFNRAVLIVSQTEAG